MVHRKKSISPSCRFQKIHSSHIIFVPIPATGIRGAGSEVIVDGAVVGEGLHALPADVSAALGALHVVTAAVLLDRRAAVAVRAHLAVRGVLAHPFLSTTNL